MLLLVFSDSHDILFTLSDKETRVIKDQHLVQNTSAILADLNGITISAKQIFKPPLIPDNFSTKVRQTIIPFQVQSQADGALIIACEPSCKCKEKELDLVSLILDQAAGAIKRAALHEEEIRILQSRIKSTAEFSGIIGKDPKMQVIYKLIEDIAPTDATILIQGESGTGKELVARAIHRKSLRKDKPFIIINCSAYPTTLLESELFGHEKGAFTGATRQKIGRFEQAHRGTVFLDEIGEIPHSAQIKLLRVLQTQKFERLGGEQTLSVDVRFLAATNKSLLQEVKDGRFREDLFYRLHVIPLNLPPLRERRNDIPLLARHFQRQFASELGANMQDFSSETMRCLLDYKWPGNVRELENSIEHAVVLSKGSRIEGSHLPSGLCDAQNPSLLGSQRTILENEKKLLMEVLEECAWNKSQASLRLGISRSTLYDKIKKYQISKSSSN
jgi:two-component system response regulator HydG